MALRRHKHWPEDDPFFEQAPYCDLSTKKACEERFADWQAMQQVILAHNVVARAQGAPVRRDGNSVFDQLVLVIAGQRATITNGDGVQSEAAFTRRILAALERYRAEGPGPGRHLYQPPEAGAVNAHP